MCRVPINWCPCYACKQTLVFWFAQKQKERNCKLVSRLFFWNLRNLDRERPLELLRKVAAKKHQSAPDSPINHSHTRIQIRCEKKIENGVDMDNMHTQRRAHTQFTRRYNMNSLCSKSRTLGPTFTQLLLSRLRWERKKNEKQKWKIHDHAAHMCTVSL